MFNFTSVNVNNYDCASANCAEAAFACAANNTALMLDAVVMASIFIIGIIGLRHLVLARGGLLLAQTLGLA